MAIALYSALTMPVEERRERYEALIERVRGHDVKNWRETFLSVLRNPSHDSGGSVATIVANDAAAK
jgi:trehalose-6-phosphate synthase